ncbi:hypothetical protein [Arenibaculum pallidiluteum]|uniref:hypothetical protein n=1 Tax=Arenibaculum pallidiluteum TaxID=2812559 RepID=UPI001A96ECD6|nr:hypothetical protein [Arenibaculum pallidiluteum]
MNAPQVRPSLKPSDSLVRIFLAAVALFGAAKPALGLEPEQREVVVVNGRVWDGGEYRETFVPSTEDEVTLMAGQGSAIIYARTLEYYWPLSRQVYVDFQRQRDVVEGQLVIRQDGEVVARETLQPYAILYPEGARNGGGRLLWGDEAERAYTEHQETERRFVRDFAAAQQAHSAYERKLVQTGAARIRGEPVEPVAPPPPLPKPSIRLVTAPEPGFRVLLEPGRYTMAVERDGRRVTGTERRLRAIGLRGRAALVADVIPTERWTRPLATNIEDARIFARPGTVLYLTLAEASRFDEAEYLPIVSPQAEPVPGRPIWVRRRPAGVDRLQVAWSDAEGDQLSRQPLKVEQTGGSSFGYRIRAARAGETPDLDAFAVAVPADASVSRGSIGLVQPAEAPFIREMVVVHPPKSSLGFALALLPIAGYVLIRGRRRIAGRFRLTGFVSSRGP